MSDPHTGNHGGHGTGHPLVGHLVGVPILLGTCLALLVLTWITYVVTFIDLGALNIWIAMIIATVKATLVCLYFMHLRWDKPFNVMVLVGSLLFVLLFVGIAMTDTLHYSNEVVWEQVELQPRQ